MNKIEIKDNKNELLYEKAKKCVIDLMTYYDNSSLLDTPKDLDDSILLSVENFIITRQTDTDYYINIIRGVVDEDDYTIEELEEECSGFEEAYKYINTMWKNYKKTNDVFYAIYRLLSHYIYSGNDEFCTYSKDVGLIENSKEWEEYLLKLYTIDNCEEAINDFDDIMNFIKNQTCFEEDQITGLLYIISGICTINL